MNRIDIGERHKHGNWQVKRKYQIPNTNRRVTVHQFEPVSLSELLPELRLVYRWRHTVSGVYAIASLGHRHQDGCHGDASKQDAGSRQSHHDLWLSGEIYRIFSIKRFHFQFCFDPLNTLSRKYFSKKKAFRIQKATLS